MATIFITNVRINSPLIVINHSNVYVCLVDTCVDTSFFSVSASAEIDGDVCEDASAVRVYSGSGVRMLLSLYIRPSGSTSSSTLVIEEAPEGTHVTFRPADFLASILARRRRQATKSFFVLLGAPAKNIRGSLGA